MTEPFDTTDHGGELFFHIVAALAQMQRRQISEKTAPGSPPRRRAVGLVVGRR